MVRRNKSSKKKVKQRGGSGFIATIKTSLVPLFFLGANHKYKKRRKTAKKISKKRRKIRNITRKFKRLRRRK